MEMQPHPEIKDRLATRLARKKQRTLKETVSSFLRNKIITFKKWYYNNEEHPYVTKFRGLKCHEDVEKSYGNKYNKHNIINIMSLWQFFQRQNAGALKDLVQDKSITCVVNTLRMHTFLRFLTKWKVVMYKDMVKEVIKCEKRGELAPSYNVALMLNPEKKVIHTIQEYVNDLYILCGDDVFNYIKEENTYITEEDMKLKPYNNLLINLKY
jgi:hypothetical protein